MFGGGPTHFTAREAWLSPRGVVKQIYSPGRRGKEKVERWRLGFSSGGVASSFCFPANRWSRHVTWVGRWRRPRTKFLPSDYDMIALIDDDKDCTDAWLWCSLEVALLSWTDLEASLLSFEKLDRASPDLWPEQLPGVAEFAASFKSPITSSPPKWMAEIERDDIDMLKELGSLTTANLMEKVRGLQNLAYQLGLDESREMTRGKFLNILEKPKK
ncbi:protein lin-52 homolog [Suncus etruscus]|nr:protein lin-52 homolog [Suncus etruscus]